MLLRTDKNRDTNETDSGRHEEVSRQPVISVSSVGSSGAESQAKTDPLYQVKQFLSINNPTIKDTIGLLRNEICEEGVKMLEKELIVKKKQIKEHLDQVKFSEKVLRGIERGKKKKKLFEANPELKKLKKSQML